MWFVEKDVDSSEIAIKDKLCLRGKNEIYLIQINQPTRWNISLPR